MPSKQQSPKHLPQASINEKHLTYDLETRDIHCTIVALLNCSTKTGAASSNGVRDRNAENHLVISIPNG